MKKFTLLFALLMIAVSGAWAETQVIARMQDLVNAGTVSGATVSTDYTTDVEKGAVYDFANQGFIKGISNDAIKAALGTKYVTVAAWVYGRPTGGCIFSYGGQSDGVKFKLTGTTMQTTTKGKADYVSQADNNFGLENQWHLVAFSIDPGFTTTKYISGHQGNFGYMYTRSRANNGPAGWNTPAEADQLFAIGSGNQGNAREEFTGSIANLTIIASDAWLGASDLVADLVGAAPSFNNVDAWKAEISALENLVGGYTTEQIASLSSVTSASQIETWLANNNKIAFDENKYYRVWNKSRSEVTKAAWDLHENSVAWAEYNSESKTQVWKFKNTGATGEYKYKIQNIGNPAAYMTSSLGGNAFHAYVNEANAGVFAITDAGNAQYQVHHSTAIGAYIFADGSNHLDGWKGDGKDLWYLEITEIDDVLTTITWNVVDENHNVLATQTMENCAEGNEYTTTLGFAYTTLVGNTTVTATKTNQTIELTYNTNGLPFTSSTSFANATWYKMTNASRGKAAYYDANEENIRVAEREGDDWSNLWAFIGDPVSGYKMVNKKAGEGLFLNAASAANGAKMTMNATATIFTLVEGNETKAEVANTIGFKLGSVYVNDYSNNGYFSFWQDGPAADQGSNWVLTEVTVSDCDWAAFKTLLDQINAMTFGDKLGQYVDAEVPGFSGYHISDFVSYFNGDFENKDESIYNEDMEVMQWILDNKQINLPQPGMLLRFKGGKTNLYVDGSVAAARPAMVALEGNETNTIFTLNEQNQLFSITTGTGFKLSDELMDSEDQNTPNIFTFQEGKAVGTYEIVSNATGAGRYWYDDQRDNKLNRNSSALAPNTNFIIEEVTDCAVANMEITEVGTATFCAPFDVTIPEGVTAYTAEIADGSWVALSEIVTGTIEAGTPVVLKGETMVKNFTGVSTVEETKEGCLVGNLSAVAPVAVGNYLLQDQPAVAGLAWYQVQNDGLTIGTNRCYMTLTGSSTKAREFFPMDFNDPTGINTIATEAATKADGKYLVKGQIVVVKAGKAYTTAGQLIK